MEREQEIFLNRAREDHREKMAQMERKFLEQKHQLERQMESAMWELEERQLADKHQLLTQQFRVSVSEICNQFLICDRVIKIYRLIKIYKASIIFSFSFTMYSLGYFPFTTDTHVGTTS